MLPQVMYAMIYQSHRNVFLHVRLTQVIFNRLGWNFKVNVSVNDAKKCVICVAPHTSNWDFIIGELAIRSAGLKAGFLMKSTWFFFPLGFLLKAIGGVPVYRGKRKNDKHSLTESLTKAYAKSDSLAIAVTPEGTRSKNLNWHKGALVIAAEANVPLILAYIDYKNKIACLDKVLTLSGDIQADLNTILRYYHDKAYMAKYPEKFSTGL